MKLSEICNIQSGTLFGPTKERSLQVLINSIESTSFESTLLFITDNSVKEKIKTREIILFNNKEKVLWNELQENGTVVFNGMTSVKPKRYNSKTVFLSLGENFVAIYPSTSTIYRPDYYEITVFHKALCGKQIIWIMLQSKVQYAGNLVLNPGKVLPNMDMVLI